MGSGTQYFVLTLPLITQRWQEDILNKRMEVNREIYNKRIRVRTAAGDHQLLVCRNSLKRLNQISNAFLRNQPSQEKDITVFL